MGCGLIQDLMYHTCYDSLIGVPVFQQELIRVTAQDAVFGQGVRWEVFGVQRQKLGRAAIYCRRQDVHIIGVGQGQTIYGVRAGRDQSVREFRGRKGNLGLCNVSITRAVARGGAAPFVQNSVGPQRFKHAGFASAQHQFAQNGWEQNASVDQYRQGSSLSVSAFRYPLSASAGCNG